MREHEFSYHDGEIPSFWWHEKGVEVEYSVPIGGSLVLDFADGRIVGFEIYDLNAPLHIGEEFQKSNGIRAVATKEEIENESE